ncbi:MAG: hypothetical protein DI539_30380 [Flavobacterium psychrophilum]|nr:MAG: hypothetical protein DI539_30380 [Flavobacterium psychrophilum]
MKKLLLVLAIGAFVASCNDGGTGTEGKDTTTTTPAAPAPDSATTTPDSLTAKPDSATTAAPDSLKK